MSWSVFKASLLFFESIPASSTKLVPSKILQTKGPRVKVFMQEARERLMDAIPALMLAMQAAKVQLELDSGGQGEVGLATYFKGSNGGGSITAFFRGEEFLNDVITVLGFKSFEDLLNQTEPDIEVEGPTG